MRSTAGLLRAVAVFVAAATIPNATAASPCGPGAGGGGAGRFENQLTAMARLRARAGRGQRDRARDRPSGTLGDGRRDRQHESAVRKRRRRRHPRCDRQCPTDREPYTQARAARRAAEFQGIVIHAVTHGGLPTGSADVHNPAAAGHEALVARVIQAAEDAFGHGLHVSLLVAGTMLFLATLISVLPGGTGSSARLRRESLAAWGASRWSVTATAPSAPDEQCGLSSPPPWTHSGSQVAAQSRSSPRIPRWIQGWAPAPGVGGVPVSASTVGRGLLDPKGRTEGGATC
jgi:hypothetical protein